MREVKFRYYQTDEFYNSIKQDIPIKTLSSNKCVFESGDTEDRMFTKIGVLEFVLKDQDRGLLILMQYTGLKDKNGVEIYEGDILRIFDPIIGKNAPVYQVNYNNLLASYELNDPKSQTYEDLYFGKAEQMIVIGNIHQNPELLTK
jgi:uncharacterized phage protein (TIGR01671 family)